MFTGIVTDIGKVKSVEKQEDTRFVVQTSLPMNNVDIGASIACAGVCLTVIEKGNDWFAVDVSEETLSRTLLGKWQEGSHLNLEKSLRIGDEIGGHLVSGHVDGLATLVAVEPVEGSHKLTFEVPDQLKGFIAEKGSVTLDGISLTVNEVEGNRFNVNIIPHTWQVTTFQYLKEDNQVHVEIDILARYVSRLLEVKS